MFYSAGKVGTQTLNSIDNSVIIVPRQNGKRTTDDPRKNAVKIAQRKVIQTGLPITFVVRDPRSRFISGLYEIIAKHLHFYGLVLQSQSESDQQCLQSHVNLFYQQKFWQYVISHALRMSPNQWNSAESLNSSRWQYHVGNWLEDVQYLCSSMDNSGVSYDIVDITDLDQYLLKLNLTYSNRNRSGDLLYWFDDVPDMHKDFFKSINTDLIMTAFAAGFDAAAQLETAHGGWYPFEEYLAAESDIYQQLCSRTVKF